MKLEIYFFLLISVLLSITLSCDTKNEDPFFVKNSNQLSENSALKNKATDGLDLGIISKK